MGAATLRFEEEAEVMVKRTLGAAVAALVCVALLSACSLLPDIPSPGYDDSGEKADVQMQHIAAAVKDHDSAALKKVFSATARERATDLDSGLKYFLSVFPPGKITWESGGCGGTGRDGPGDAWLSSCSYKVSAGEKKYEIYFAYVETDTDHPGYLGIYGLGVVPFGGPVYTAIGAPQPFNLWASQYDLGDDGVVTGKPGVYIPGIRGSILHTTGPTPAVEMQHIADAVKSHDAAALKELFSPAARLQVPNLDNELKYFLSLFPSGRMSWESEGGLTWNMQDNIPACYFRGGYATASEELCPVYKVSVNGEEFALGFVEVAVDQPDTDNVGLYALRVAPYTAKSGTAHAPPKQLSAWAKSYLLDINGKMSGIPGVYMPQQ
ncbi:MAG TPA: DUF5104 domain-containing protein [Galbitalea sp.]|jgi:hypothetical protein|nr:DUF5104 domain-containing protein [Galbitalea sp.]